MMKKVVILAVTLAALTVAGCNKPAAEDAAKADEAAPAATTEAAPVDNAATAPADDAATKAAEPAGGGTTAGAAEDDRGNTGDRKP